MNNNFARLLKNQEQIEEFLTLSLGIRLKDYRNIEYKIITSEKGVVDGLQNPTSTVSKFRDRLYATDQKRLELQKRIVNELFALPLLRNDDLIKLGKGGALPRKPRKGSQAFILIGLPASGKSGIATRIAQTHGAIILDSDFAKRKLPEYSKYPWGASIVHAESSMIVFGDEKKSGFASLYAKAITEKYNLVIPKIGAEPDDILPYCEALKNAGYKVHLTLIYLPKEKSTIRALMRFYKTKRYVPLSLIFDVYGDNPALTYFLLKNRNPGWIDSFGIINTDVPTNKPAFGTDIMGNNPAKLFKPKKNVLI